ncbi:hypothetical protein, partial [Streptomyces sp. NPDC005989]|uniref:hypothetical protein n=1 Tax=Streptomyces sp. NPDC005989 TaxID=3156727 RepID=UPI0033C89847
PVFAPAIAAGDIVALHPDPDLRLPQQSIRTFNPGAGADSVDVLVPAGHGDPPSHRGGHP